MATADMATYETIKTWHRGLPPFSPYIPVGLLPYLSFILLAATFALAFYFSTLPKHALARQTGIALMGSVLGGFGIVTLFCSVGVYV